MEPKEFLAFLARLEKLKCNTRHSWTSSGRHESVAEHSWRLAMLAMLLRDALPEVDMDKVLRMCLIHDVGEAVTGDIPSFQKTDANEETERQAIAELLSPCLCLLYTSPFYAWGWAAACSAAVQGSCWPFRP